MNLNPMLNRRRMLRSAAGGAVGLAASGRVDLRGTAADAIELQFWNPASDDLGGPIIQDLVDGYNAGPGAAQGITVNSVVNPIQTGYDKYSTAMASSASPDVVMTYSYDPVVPWIANGFVQPLDEFFPALGLNQEDFYPVIWEAMTFGGKVYGFFQEFDFDEMYWNTEIHDGDLPKTIDEFDELCAEYTQFDDNGSLTQAGIIPWEQGGFTAGGYGTWATIWGARFYDTENRKFTITQPENTAFLEWYLKYVDMLGGREKADAFVSALPQTFWGDVFLFGKTAFGMQFEAMPEIIRQVGDGTLQYQIGHPPEVPGVTTETTQILGADVFLVPSKSPHVQEAAAFATYMTSNDALLAWALPIGQMIPVIKTANDPQLFETQWWYKIYLESLESGKVLAPILSPQAVLFNQSMGLVIDEVTYKQKSPQEALADCEKKVMDAVEQFRSAHPDWEGE